MDDKDRSWPRSTPPGTSWLPRRSHRTSTWWAGSPPPVPPGEPPLSPGASSRATRPGSTLPRDSVRVGPVSSAALSLSDLVLGTRTANLGWRRTPDDTVLFNPLRTYRAERGDGAVLRDRGSAPGPVHRGAGGAEEGLGWGHLQEDFRRRRQRRSSSSSRSRPPRRPSSTHRSLKLDRLKPGNYVLELVVVDADGRKDRRAQEFQVVEGKKTVSGNRKRKR